MSIKRIMNEINSFTRYDTIRDQQIEGFLNSTISTQGEFEYNISQYYSFRCSLCENCLVTNSNDFTNINCPSCDIDIDIKYLKLDEQSLEILVFTEFCFYNIIITNDKMNSATVALKSFVKYQSTSLFKSSVIETKIYFRDYAFKICYNSADKITAGFLERLKSNAIDLN